MYTVTPSDVGGRVDVDVNLTASCHVSVAMSPSGYRRRRKTLAEQANRSDRLRSSTEFQRHHREVQLACALLTAKPLLAADAGQDAWIPSYRTQHPSDSQWEFVSDV